MSQPEALRMAEVEISAACMALAQVRALALTMADAAPDADESADLVDAIVAVSRTAYLRARDARRVLGEALG